MSSHPRFAPKHRWALGSTAHAVVFICPSSFGEPRKCWCTATKWNRNIQLPYAGNGYQFEAQEVVDCLRSGRTESEVMPHRDSVSLMETMDTIRRQWGLTFPNEAD